MTNRTSHFGADVEDSAGNGNTNTNTTLHGADQLLSTANRASSHWEHKYKELLALYEDLRMAA
jgi:hypothetical protein